MQGVWVGKQDVDGIWSKVEPFVMKALKKWLPAWYPEDLKNDIKNDMMQLWVAYDDAEQKVYGVCMTQVMKYPRMKMFHVFLVGGEALNKWRDLWIDAAEKRARDEQCDVLQATGRRGWTSMPGAFESAIIINKLLK